MRAAPLNKEFVIFMFTTQLLFCIEQSLFVGCFRETKIIINYTLNEDGYPNLWIFFDAAYISRWGSVLLFFLVLRSRSAV